MSLKFDKPHFIKVPILFSTAIKLKLGHGFLQFIYRFKLGIYECCT